MKKHQLVVEFEKSYKIARAFADRLQYKHASRWRKINDCQKEKNKAKRIRDYPILGPAAFGAMTKDERLMFVVKKKGV